MQTSETHQNIAELDLLKDLSQDSFNKVLQKTRERTASAGEALFSQGVNDKTYVYLLQGEIELLDKGTLVRTVRAGSEEAMAPLAHRQPREFTARARRPVKYISIESQTLDMLVAWENQNNYEVHEVPENPLSQQGDWLLRLLSRPVFNRASPRQLQTLFTHFEPQKVSKGQELISQDSNPDYFYILVNGRASVIHRTQNHPDGLKLAILNPGDTFGEDGLISHKQRNASVTMLNDGMVIRLSPEHFFSFVEHSPNQNIAYDEARQRVHSGNAKWLDVRMPNEFKKDHLAGALNLPLILLRVKIDTELNRNETYILYCDDGHRSAAGAFLLRQRGFNVMTLEGGLSAKPNQVEALYTLEKTA